MTDFAAIRRQLESATDYDTVKQIAHRALTLLENADRDQVLEEAARLIETDESPFHSTGRTEAFWTDQKALAARVRAAKVSP